MTEQGVSERLQPRQLTLHLLGVLTQRPDGRQMACVFRSELTHQPCEGACDPTTALVFIAAAQASTQHVNPNDLRVRDGDFIRDDLRRPVTLSALARSLGLPVETTRRHVLRLVAQNLAERTEHGGVVVTTRQLDTPTVRAAVLENNINLNKLLSDLAAR